MKLRCHYSLKSTPQVPFGACLAGASDASGELKDFFLKKKFEKKKKRNFGARPFPKSTPQAPLGTYQAGASEELKYIFFFQIFLRFFNFF